MKSNYTYKLNLIPQIIWMSWLTEPLIYFGKWWRQMNTKDLLLLDLLPRAHVTLVVFTFRRTRVTWALGTRLAITEFNNWFIIRSSSSAILHTTAWLAVRMSRILIAAKHKDGITHEQTLILQITCRALAQYKGKEKASNDKLLWYVTTWLKTIKIKCKTGSSKVQSIFKRYLLTCLKIANIKNANTTLRSKRYDPQKAKTVKCLRREHYLIHGHDALTEN